jgi:predicted  nucleic acid-binding Zn-ribbon protein
MEAVTVRDVGKTGVMLALSDSMEAAKARHEVQSMQGRLAEKEMRIRALMAEVDRLTAEAKEKDKKIVELRRTLKHYREQRMEAYARGLNGKSQDETEKINRLQGLLAAFSVGMVSVMLLTWGIIAFVR